MRRCCAHRSIAHNSCSIRRAGIVCCRACVQGSSASSNGAWSDADFAMPSDARPLSIAIAALGGQGGGVLADWLVAVAELHGWIVQATSVAGVAQRTGATVYYLEMSAPPRTPERRTVLALMPVSGDVDLVVAAELIEAGRAVVRGIVTPERTTVVASTHRIYGIRSEEHRAGQLCT